MLPVLANNDSVNGVSVHSELLCDSELAFTGSYSLAYFKHLLVRKLAGALNHLTSRLPSLGYHIQMIVGVGSKEKVVRSNARPVVTPVKHPKPSWDCSKMNLPRKTVSGDSFHFKGFDRKPDVMIELPITINIFGTGPLPAGFGFGHLFPKSFFKWNTLPYPLEGISTFFRAAFLGMFFGIEKNPTEGTFQLNHKKLSLSFGLMRNGLTAVSQLLRNLSNPTSNKRKFYYAY